MFEWDQDAQTYGVTAVENRFILDYLPAAKGDQVKVYLWGLFACAWKGPAYTLEEMSADLDMPVTELEAALRYWERRALVSRISDEPPAYRFYSPAQRQAAANGGLAVDTDYVSFAECVYAAFGDRRKVNPAEIALAWEWVQDVGLSQEAVLMLLQHCMAQRGAHFSFKAAEKLAVAMKEAGVTGPEDAEHFLQHSQTVQDGARKVLSRMGKRRAATEDELALYEKWTGAWGFEPQAVLDACRETTGGDPSFKYLDGILNRLRTQADARTGEGMAQKLDQEKEEREKAQEVFSRLGVKISGPAAVTAYRSLLSEQPHGVLLLAADECLRTHKKLDDMKALLTSWRNRGLTTEEAVRQYLARYREANLALRELFDACGHSGRPTEADRKLYEKWRGWGYGPELLRCAAEQARNAEGGKIAYLDKVLETWHDAGITSVEQAQGRRRPQAAQGRKTVSAQQYGQRQYTEAELLAVSDDLIEEARKQRG